MVLLNLRKAEGRHLEQPMEHMAHMLILLYTKLVVPY